MKLSRSRQRPLKSGLITAVLGLGWALTFVGIVVKGDYYVVPLTFLFAVLIGVSSRDFEYDLNHARAKKGRNRS